MIDIRTLRAAGLSAEQILKVVEEDQAQEREHARIRQRNHRARNGDLRDKRDTTYKEPSFLPNSKKERKGRKIDMPIDWRPTIAVATEDEGEFERFKRYCKANGKTYVDWDAAWGNWRTSPYRGGQHGNGQGRRHGSVLDAFDRIGERLKAAGATDDYIPGSSGPRPLELDTQVRPAGLKLVPKR